MPWPCPPRGVSDPASNSYPKTISVVDDDGGTGTSSATVTVLSAGGGAQALGANINALLSAGTVSSQTANQLMSSVDAAAASLANGNTTAASGQLGAFINKVQSAIQSGKITAADGAALIAFAQRVLRSIGG